MKIECIQTVGVIQFHMIYTFDADKEADVQMVKEVLKNEEITLEDVENFSNEI